MIFIATSHHHRGFVEIEENYHFLGPPHTNKKQNIWHSTVFGLIMILPEMRIIAVGLQAKYIAIVVEGLFNIEVNQREEIRFIAK